MVVPGMSGRTPRFGLTTLDRPDEKFDHDSSRFGTFNRLLLDRLLAYAAEQHVHDGQAIEGELPPAPDATAGEPGTGILGPGETAYYRYTRVDATGMEGPASRVLAARTPNQIAAPSSPSVVPTEGFLPSGVFSYATTWWTGNDRCETPASPLTTVTAASREGGSVGNLIDVGKIDPAADGWNLYRKGPMDIGWSRVASIGASNGSTYVDQDTVEPIAMPLPAANSTFSRGSIIVTIPYNGPDVPQWKLYRTFNPSDWQDSLIAWTDTTVVTDTGLPGREGAPQDSSEALAGVPQVELHGESEGILPSGLLTVPVQISLVVEGVLQPSYSRFIWVNEFDVASITSIRARIMNGAPEDRALIVSLERKPANGPWAELERCRTWVLPGETAGDLTVVDIDFNDVLVPGEAIRALVVQDGGGGHTDADLVLSVMLLCQYGSVTETHTWSA